MPYQPRPLTAEERKKQARDMQRQFPLPESLRAKPTAQEPMAYHYFVDGGVLGRNPSTVGVYWSMGFEYKGRFKLAVERRVSHEHFTNNEAEWLALRTALEHACDHHTNEVIRIRSDSQLIVKQFNRVVGFSRSAHLEVIAVECWRLAEVLKDCQVVWTPRQHMVERLGH